MKTVSASQKGYISVFEEIRMIILKDRLQPGDKLPSERYLSEKLNVSRSSVREALRAMELLGIINTRRGEGTFLSNIDDHHLFQLIGDHLIYSEKQTDEIREFKAVVKHHLDETNSDNRIMHRVYNLLKLYDEAFNNEGDHHV